MAEYEFHYSRFPALAAYIDRVGAEQLNFRRFMIKEHHGHYYVEKVLIKILDDFSIECRSPDYEPTEAEATAIKAELEKVEFPHSIRGGLPQVDDLLESGLVTGKLFTFLDNTRTQVIMCQERREKQDGGKIYVPWTLFMVRGGKPEWKQMEPDGKLPFWKPKVRRNKAHLMVHEGAKTAAFVDGLINDPERKEERKNHPWADELARFEHWGAIGGALATHRCYYDELHREKIEGDLVYVCDNDADGVEAVKTFSKCYGRMMFAIRFDNAFGQGWDLADRMPPELVNKNGTAKRRLLSMQLPATWATVALPKQKAQRQAYKLSHHFKAEWLHSIKPLRFHHARLPLNSFDSEEFNALVGPFSDVDDTAQLVTKVAHGQAIKEMYHPGKKTGLCHEDDGTSFINTYVPSCVQDFTDSEASALRKHDPDFANPFDEFLNYLVPDPVARDHLWRWAATLMSGVATKILYAPLLVSETQGVGKTTFANIVAEVLGIHNTASIRASTVVESTYQYWGEKHLVIINEIHEGHSKKIYDRVKEVITDPTIEINKKWQKPYMAANYVNICACSNFLRALNIPNQDRRWMVIRAAENKAPRAVWVRLHDWLENEDGYRKVKLLAKDYVEKHGAVGKEEEAPETRAKTEMIEESFSDAMGQLHEPFKWVKRTSVANCNMIIKGNVVTIDKEEVVTLDAAKRVARLAKKGCQAIMLDRDGLLAIEDFYANRPQQQRAWRESAAHVRAVALAAGLFVGNERITARAWKGSRHARIISTSRKLAEMDPNELARAAAGSTEKDEDGDGYFLVKLGKDEQPIRVAMIELRVLAAELKDL
jgi:hypothetical protein